jgi:hypothetical protein
MDSRGAWFGNDSSALRTAWKNIPAGKKGRNSDLFNIGKKFFLSGQPSVIGAKRGKLSPLGEESESVKLEFGANKETVRSSRNAIVLSLLNRVFMPLLYTPKKVQERKRNVPMQLVTS